MIRKLLNLPEDLLAGVDKWRRNQYPIPNANEALRRLVIKALEVEGIRERKKIEVEEVTET